MSRVVDFADLQSSATAPDTLFTAAGKFNVYSSDALYISAKGTSAEEGDAYYNSTVDDLKYYGEGKWIRNESNLNNSDTSDPTVNDDSDDGYTVLSLWLNTVSGDLFRCVDDTVGAAVWTQMSANAELVAHEADTSTHGVTEIAGVGESQTFTNKTMTTPVLNTPQINTPSKIEFKEDTESNLETYAALTGHDGEACYATDTQKYYGIKDDALVEFGSGGGGGLDVFSTNDFEEFLVVDADGTSATFLGSGGTFDGSIAADSTSAISGDVSLRYTAGASSAYDWFEIEEIELDTKQTATSIRLRLIADMSNFDANVDLIIWDKTNGDLLTDGNDILTAGASRSFYEYTCYIPATCTSISWGCHINSGATNADYFLLDDAEFSTSPWITKDLYNTSDWEDIGLTTGDFTGFGTVTAIDIQKRRMGDSLEVQGKFTTGTTTATEAQINLPSSLAIDLTKVSTVRVVGHGYLHSTGTTTVKNWAMLATGNDTYLNIGYNNYHTGSGALTPVNGNALPSATIFSFYATVPIKDWVAESEHIVIPSKAGSQMYNISQAGNALSNLNQQIQFNSATATIINDTSFGELIEVDHSTDPSTYTAIKPCRITYSYSSQIATTSKYPSLIIYTSTTVTILGDEVAGNNQRVNLSWSFSLDTGEYFTSGTNNEVSNSAGLVYLSFEARPKEATFLTAVPNIPVAYIKDVKPSGTSGGTFTSGAWRTRDLNTLSGDTSFVSLSSNQFMLQKGTYDIDIEVPAYKINGHRARLQNITAGVTSENGSNAYAAASLTSPNSSFVSTTVKITTTTVFEVQHSCLTTGITTGFGFAISLAGSTERYTQVKITKLDWSK